jgi:hypothetical protein
MQSFTIRTLGQRGVQEFTKSFPGLAFLVGELVPAVHPTELSADDVIQSSLPNMVRYT